MLVGTLAALAAPALRRRAADVRQARIHLLLNLSPCALGTLLPMLGILAALAAVARSMAAP